MVGSVNFYDGVNWHDLGLDGFNATDVVGFASDNAYAVGYTNDSPTKGQIWQWNGVIWTKVVEYADAENRNFLAIGASGPDCICAAGGTAASGGHVYIWNGASWTYSELVDPQALGDIVHPVIPNGVYVYNEKEIIVTGQGIDEVAGMLEAYAFVWNGWSWGMFKKTVYPVDAGAAEQYCRYNDAYLVDGGDMWFAGEKYIRYTFNGQGDETAGDNTSIHDPTITVDVANWAVGATITFTGGTNDGLTRVITSVTSEDGGGGPM